jgi:hypothetical protein
LKKKKVPKTNMAATFDDATFVTRKITQPRLIVVYPLPKLVYGLFYLHLQDVGNRVTLWTIMSLLHFFMLYWDALGMPWNTI